MEERPTEIPPDASKDRSWLSSRKNRRLLAVTVVIVVVAIFVAFWGSQPQRSYSPSDILNSPQEFEGKTVQVRGIAMEHNESGHTFLLWDYNVNLTVQYNSLPQGFETGNEMIVKGTLRNVEGTWVFVASDILMGHPR